MKANVFRIALLTATFFTATFCLQAAPSLPVTKPPVTPTNLTGPTIDPAAAQGQWFKDIDTGEEENRTHEFYDNMSDSGGGNKESYAISGFVVSITTNALGDITAFDIEATIWNDSASSEEQWADGSNSHGESLATPSNYVGTLADTKLTAEFAIADIILLPGVFGHPATPYRNALPYIIAENEDQRAWYCWNELDPPNGQEHGNYYVPTWDFGDIHINRSATRTLKFSVPAGMDATDPRYNIIMGSYSSEDEVLANRTTSLKISTWIDDIGTDSPGPEGMLRDSDASVFHNEEEPYDPTHKMHWAQLPDPNGWDVRACRDPQLDEWQKVLADDFRCTHSGPITNITFWGSFKSDEYNREAPYQGITNFHLSFHKDIPDPDEQGPLYSMPMVPAEWEQDIDPDNPPAGWSIEIIPEIPSSQGWWDPNHEQEYHLDNHEEYFRYVLTIPTNDAFVQTSNEIYWLDITVYTEKNPMTEQPYLWGWKTSVSEHFMDDAVFADMPVIDTNQWKELIDPVTSESLDLAFLIDGPEQEKPEEQYDFGDAPDLPYPTLASSSGANHTIVPGAPYFDDGTQTDQPDPEPDGQPTAGADGDDLNGTTPDDEDGITIPALYAGQSGSVIITVDDGAGGTGSGGGYVDAWIDFNGDGNWATPAEQIVSGWLPQGSNAVAFVVPSGSSLGQTFGRFRINSLAAGLPPTGSASDGEVEDHKLTISLAEENLDWGDAPDSLTAPPGFNTLAVNAGANHTIVSGIFMGTLIDPELDGQPNPTATGDDITTSPDEDGVLAPFPPLIPGKTALFTVMIAPTAPPGWLDIWLDVDASGTWTGPDYVFSGPVIPGPNPVPVTLPYNAVPGTSFMRVRYNTANGGPLPPTGWAADGEVEDYQVTIEAPELDWGDAPDTYKTLSASAGPRHIIATGVQLGVTVDAEPNGQPSADANADGADEDGVSFVGHVVAGSNATIQVSSTGGSLDGWIDYNGNLIFDDPSEHIFGGSSAVLTSSPTNLTFTVPSQPALGSSYARFRLSTAGGLPPDNSGLASIPDGEVEDYTVDIYQPAPTNLVITNLTVTVSNNLSKIEWTAQPNITYQAQSTTNLMASNSWADVGGWVIQNWQTNSASTIQYYRVIAPWTP